MKKLVIIAIILIASLTISFFWKEHFDLSKTINADKINAYATSLAAILTAVTVFLLYKQNQHQIKDTRTASQPDLFPSELNVYTEDTEMLSLSTTGEVNSYPQFYSFSTGPVKTKDISPRVFVDLHNVGFGVAKNIKVKWIYDKEEVRKYFIEVYKAGWYDLGRTEFDFIAADKSIKLEIPEDYMSCFGKLLNRNIPGGEPNSKPKAKLQLKYRDIHNEEYRKEFDLITFSPNTLVQIRFEQVFN